MPPRRPVAPIPLALPALRLPPWVRGFLRRQPGRFPDATSRMRLAIGLAAENGARGTGGPFGAAVFERASGRLVAVGVNRVEPSGQSHAHAELLALALAQRARGVWDLGAPGLPRHELVSSSDPVVRRRRARVRRPRSGCRGDRLRRGAQARALGGGSRAAGHRGRARRAAPRGARCPRELRRGGRDDLRAGPGSPARRYSERSSARPTGRMSPSWATEATSVPSREKMLPRAKPRAPAAAGLSCT